LLSLLLVSVARSAERIRIGYSSISGSYIGIWVAHDAGLFTKEGLEDQIILIPSGSQLAQVTVAGEVEVGSFNGSSAMAASLNGADIKIIGNTVNKMIFSIYAKPEIKTIEGLKGKKLGVTRFGSSTDISARYALRKHKLQPEKDVTILQMGSVSSIMGGLQGGSIDAGVVSPPTLFAVDKLGFKELINITDMDLAFPNPSLIVQGGILKNRPEIVDKFMRAYVRGIHRAKTDKGLTLKSIARYSKVDDPFFSSESLRSLRWQGFREGPVREYGGNAECLGRPRENVAGGERSQTGAVYRYAVSRPAGKERTIERSVPLTAG
jgi:NitT/TauT family transport system substrate-binding protein